MPPLRKPWTRYRMADENKEYLTDVSHITHLQPALRIIRDGKIKPSLVTECDVLKTQRVLGTWLSPNTWHNGSRYGNLCFYFPVEKLLRRKKIYWVEAMAYQTVACRFLVTNEDYDYLLKRYDPSEENGPLLLEAGKYYWNNSVSLQFLLDGSIPVNKCNMMKLTKHHARYCCLENTCSDKEKDMATYKVSQLLVSHVLSHDFDCNLNLFTHESIGMRKTSIKPLDSLREGVNYILTLAHRTSFNNILQTDDEDILDAIVKAGLIHLANNDIASFRKVIGVLKDVESFEDSFLSLVKKRFELSSINEFLD